MGHSGKQRLILLTGANGYIGGRLLPLLEARPSRIRCLARRPDYLKQRVGPETEVVYGDLLDFTSLEKAMRDVDTAYFLVHSPGMGSDNEERDRLAAANFGRAALQAGVRQIIFLGCLANGDNLSPHQANRHEVGKILHHSGVPTIEFRASIVIGSGSLSFEMVRALVEKLPVMATPAWMCSMIQPIAIEDTLQYLMQALYRSEPENAVYEIGGKDITSYEGIMREYGRQRGLRRLIIPVPVLGPRLSGLWLALTTPLYYAVGRQLIESALNDSVVTERKALEVFSIRPRTLSEAIMRALANEDREFAATHWSDALEGRSLSRKWGGVHFGPRRVVSYSRFLEYPPEEIFARIQCVGGQHGWYAYNWLWRLRGAIDRLIGGVGIRRGRRAPCDIRLGDAIDFWRVERFEPDRMLLLSAEMKMPGRAWLHFEVWPHQSGSEARMTAIFDPVGVWGRIYWFMVYPFHFLVFNGMFQGIVRAVNRTDDEECA